MLKALNKDVPSDLSSISYLPLWKEWMSKRSKPAPKVDNHPVNSPSSATVVSAV